MPEFNFNLAQMAKNLGLDLVEGGHPDDYERLLGIVHHVARTLPRFSTDDVWREMARQGIEELTEGRILGAVMRTARLLPICAPLNEWILSERVACHGRPVRVWRSLVYSA